MKDTKKIEQLIIDLLREVGENPAREGLRKTPYRVAKMFYELTSGYTQKRPVLLNNAIFTHKVHNMIILKDIEIYSLCEHHLLPFFGKCHVCYIAKKKILGVSKIARIIDLYAKRLQLQERLTEEIMNAIQEILDPIGIGVVIEAQHFCMMMRGVTKQHPTMITSSLIGSFRENLATREEFLSFIRA